MRLYKFCNFDQRHQERKLPRYPVELFHGRANGLHFYISCVPLSSISGPPLLSHLNCRLSQSHRSIIEDAAAGLWYSPLNRSCFGHPTSSFGTTRGRKPIATRNVSIIFSKVNSPYSMPPNYPQRHLHVPLVSELFATVFSVLLYPLKSPSPGSMFALHACSQSRVSCVLGRGANIGLFGICKIMSCTRICVVNGMWSVCIPKGKHWGP